MTYKNLVFHLVKLPLILALITLGIMLEGIIEMPFRTMCAFDRWFGKGLR